MAKILQHWYILAAALALSLASSVGLILMRKDTWMSPPEPIKRAAPLSDVGPTASQSFREWEFSAVELENMRLQLEGEKESLRKKEAELQRLEGQIRSEVADLKSLRSELEALQESIQADLISIDEDERQNVRNLSKLYSEMKADAAVKVLDELDIETVVKILSAMPSDASARILGNMTEKPGQDSIARAAEITDAIRRLKQ